MEFVQGVIMKIQSVNMLKSVSCQPIKPSAFGGKKPSIEDMAAEQDSVSLNEDELVLSDNSILEQKYDLACRLAAYYKTQCQQLLENGSCLA